MATAILFAILTLLSTLITLGMHVAAHVLLNRDTYLPRGTRPVSILRPLKGSIESLEQNLESLCQQHHPTFEIIVGAADANDPALLVARRVREKYPQVTFRILTGEWATGLNPKVRLLRQLLGQARYDSVLISDDNVRVRPDYLSVMAGALAKPNTGLVSNLVVGIGGRTLGAICENLQLNTFILSSVAASFLFGHSVVVGKSMLFRRDALMNAGGLAAVADVLAEDHLLGRAVHNAGYRVVTLGHPVYNVNVDWTLSRTLGRHLRWCKIRANVVPWLFPFELILQPLLLATLTLVTYYLSNSPVSVGWIQAVFTAVFTTTLSEFGLIRRVQKHHFRLAEILLLPLRSIIAVIAHLGSGFVTVVRWRDTAYRIGRDSRLVPLSRPRTIIQRTPFRRAA